MARSNIFDKSGLGEFKVEKVTPGAGTGTINTSPPVGELWRLNGVQFFIQMDATVADRKAVLGGFTSGDGIFSATSNTIMAASETHLIYWGVGVEHNTFQMPSGTIYTAIPIPEVFFNSGDLIQSVVETIQGGDNYLAYSVIYSKYKV